VALGRAKHCGRSNVPRGPKAFDCGETVGLVDSSRAGQFEFCFPQCPTRARSPSEPVFFLRYLSRLFCEEQTLRERPLRIHPLRIATEACAFAHARCFVAAIFVRAFRPNCFVLAEIDLKISAANVNSLLSTGA